MSAIVVYELQLQLFLFLSKTRCVPHSATDEFHITIWFVKHCHQIVKYMYVNLEVAVEDAANPGRGLFLAALQLARVLPKKTASYAGYGKPEARMRAVLT